ncbi:hypothetical protein BJ508DRAFT_6764 [Ascobolus immersus RN42]|uniref:EF-hand domain-containing protein n=1 Tax=Ascobolus immersus RN42 TaxID=1160509 RepID=A0A3N4IMF2_ASCIM|nr:hypothetical protein BJ508DRAFT_6764 [Ascobolus immersus RN42]
MFFAPALIVAAASAVSAAPLAQQFQESIQQNIGLDTAFDPEDKDAFFLFDIFKKLIGKRDLESFDQQEIARALAGFQNMDAQKQATLGATFMKWGIPILGGLISGLPDIIHGKKDQKRDVPEFNFDTEGVEDKDAFFLFDIFKKLIGKRDLNSGEPLNFDLNGVEDKDAFFLFDIFKKLIGKRDLSAESVGETMNAMSEEEKKAFWGAIAKWGIPIISGLFSGMGGSKEQKRALHEQYGIDVEDKDAFFLFDIFNKLIGKRDLSSESVGETMNAMSEEEKKAFWGAIAKWGIPIISGLFSGMGSSEQKRSLQEQHGLDSFDPEDKDAFFLFDIFKKIIGKRGLEGELGGSDLDTEDKDAFFLFDLFKKIIGKRGLDGEFDAAQSGLEDGDKDAFFLFDLFKKIIGKRGLEGEHEDFNLEDKDAFFLFDLFKKIIGKRDLESFDEDGDKDAFFLFDLFKKIIGKRDLESFDEDGDKDAFFLFDLFKKIIGKRDLESFDEDGDKDAFFLFDLFKKIIGKRGLEGEVEDFNVEDKDAFFLFDLFKKIIGKRGLEGEVEDFNVEDKDAFFLFDIFKKLIGKRDLESQDVAKVLSSLSAEDKEAFLGPLISIGLPLITSLFGGNKRRDLYDLPSVPSAARRSVQAEASRAASSFQDQGLLDALNDF